MMANSALAVSSAFKGCGLSFGRGGTLGVSKVVGVSFVFPGDVSSKARLKESFEAGAS